MTDIGAVFANLADTGEPPLISQLARASWLAGTAKSAVNLGICDKLSDGKEVYLRREELPLSSWGTISLGEKVEDNNPVLVAYSVG